MNREQAVSYFRSLGVSHVQSGDAPPVPLDQWYPRLMLCAEWYGVEEGPGVVEDAEGSPVVSAYGGLQIIRHFGLVRCLQPGCTALLEVYRCRLYCEPHRKDPGRKVYRVRPDSTHDHGGACAHAGHKVILTGEWNEDGFGIVYDEGCFTTYAISRSKVTEEQA